MFNVFTEYHIIARDKYNVCITYLIILAVPTTKSITAYFVNNDVTCFNTNPLSQNIGLGMQKSITNIDRSQVGWFVLHLYIYLLLLA